MSIHHDSIATATPVWDPDQLAVVTAPRDARLIVTAGPGTGKTAVACGRVANLVTKQGVEPSCVMLLSFTRTAVAEIRSRIAAYVGSETRAAGIKIATLDSTTWAMLSGLDTEANSLLGGYDANIDRLCTLVREGDDSLLDYLERLDQVVVDEAQDILGNRAELVSELIRRLDPNCGVTVLADACQSIYGFTNENGEGDDATPRSLLDTLPAAGTSGGFRQMRLTRLHRTSDKSLIELLAATRPIVEAATTDDREHFRLLRDVILRTAPRIRVNRMQLVDETRGKNDLMVLYRTRAEALLTASMLVEGDVPHRLRLSGLPTWLQPWIGVVFSDYDGDSIDEASFLRLWEEKACASLPGSPPATAAWESCLNVASRNGQVRLEQLRAVLSRSRPPLDFCAVDSGFTGPVVGTVHASKGREADDVLLYLPEERDGDLAWAEETRVLYVGATRARKTTRVAEASPTYSTYLEGTGRPVKYRRNETRAQFEVGRMTDLDEFSVVSKTLHGDAGTAVRQQQRFAREAATTEKWILKNSADWNWGEYRLIEDSGGDEPFGSMSEAFKRDVYAIARELGARSPSTIPHIRKIGVRTVAVSADASILSQLAPPYSTTGFFLVPVVRAWTMTKFWGGRAR
jgi:hypothetical protein